MLQFTFYRTARFVMAAAVVLVSWGPARGAVLWFDETGGGSGYSTFSSLAQGYAGFMGAAGQTIDFNNLAEGALPSTQYAGVTFSNVNGGTYSSYSGIRTESGAIAQHVTGYEGTYMPNGDKVYVKFGNDAACTPFTIDFATPVSTVGAFVGMGVEGGVHTLTISAYNSAQQLLGTRTVQSWLWEADPYWQNYESFFALHSSVADISRITILNDAKTNFANALILDNLSYSTAETNVPEPQVLLLLALAGWAVLLARPAQAALAVRRC